MSIKFDAEDLVNMLYDIMTTGSALNNKIAAVDAEKTANGQTITPALASIDSGSYYPQSWSDKILNTSPSIFYGIEDVSSLDGGGATAKTYKLFVELVLVDSGQTNDAWKRIARYSRALEELFQTNFAPNVAAGKVKIDQVRPIAFKTSLNSNEEIKVGGISITIALV